MIYYDFRAFHYLAIFFILIATSLWYYSDVRDSKLLRGFHVFGALLSFTSGYYLSKRLAFTLGLALPYWLIAKYILGLIVTVVLPILRTFKPQYNKWYFGINIALFISLMLLATYKPF